MTEPSVELPLLGVRQILREALMVRSSRGSVAGPGADRLTAARRYHLTEVNSVVPNDLATSVMGGAAG